MSPLEAANVLTAEYVFARARHTNKQKTFIAYNTLAILFKIIFVPHCVAYSSYWMA